MSRKLALAAALNAGRCGGTYTDASLVTAATVSGMAADLWEGEGIDRARFVEIWARDTDAALRPRRISVPLLCADLIEQKRYDEVAALQAARPQMFGPGYNTRIVTGLDVDMDELEVATHCPMLTPRQIRRFSYPSVYYEQVRCATSHEYQLGPDATAHPMEDDAEVSYSNRLVKGFIGRLIHFHPPWLEKVVGSIAVRVAPEIDSATPRSRPAVWWIGGG